jgi:hypothetical protein
MMAERENLLRNIRPGDIFHGHRPNGVSLICLATRVEGSIIEARTVTSQYELVFDRDTGEELDGDQKSLGSIDSVAPLPIGIHDVLLGLDRRMRLERNPERMKLTEAEKKAVHFVDEYYGSNPMERH